MKKVLAGIVLALLVIALPVGLIGCKKQGATKGIEGDYTFDKVVFEWADGVSDGTKQAVEAEFDDYGKATINKDGTWVMYDKDGDVMDEGTWEKAEGDTYTVQSNDTDSEIPFDKITIKNGVATVEIEQEDLFTAVMTFKRK